MVARPRYVGDLLLGACDVCEPMEILHLLHHTLC